MGHKETPPTVVAWHAISGRVLVNQHYIIINKKKNINQHYGDAGLSTDHIINRTNKLFIHLSMLLSSMLRHSVVPSNLRLSTVIPIPKSKRESLNMLNSYDNYRGIALSSVIGKVLDHIILVKNEDILNSSDLQFGFKKTHSIYSLVYILGQGNCAVLYNRWRRLLWTATRCQQSF